MQLTESINLEITLSDKTLKINKSIIQFETAISAPLKYFNCCLGVYNKNVTYF